MSKIDYSFVFPVYNEEKYLHKQIHKFLKIVQESNVRSYEILIVENGSQDRSWEIAKKIAKNDSKIRSLRINKASYGRAIKHGLLSSLGKYVFLLNLDYFDIDFISEAIDQLGEFQIVIGSKTLQESRDTRHISRKVQTYIFNQINKHLFGYPGTDTHGVKAFRNSSVLKETAQKCCTKHELFDTELLMRLIRNKSTFIEIPTLVEEIRSSRYFPLKRFLLVIVDVIKLTSATILQKDDFGFPTADDFGLDLTVDEAIIDQARTKAIKAISVLPNLVTKGQVTKIKSLTKDKKILVGVHLNFVKNKPISKVKNVLSLVDKGGNFFPTPVFLAKVFMRQIDFTEVRKEVLEQVSILEKWGVSPSYLDSEQHIHTFSPMNEVVQNIARAKQLKMRSKKSTLEYLKKKPLRYFVYLVVDFVLSKRQKRKILRGGEIDMDIFHPGNNYD